MPSPLLPQHTEAALCCWLWEATSAGNSAGCQVTFRTVWSKSACSTRRTEAALWLLPSEGSAQPGRGGKKKAWPPSATTTRASGRLEMPQVRVSPFRNVPQIFPAIELLVSPLLLFLEDLLYCIQIHIWKRLPHAKSNFIVAFWLLSPTEEILHSQPTNLSSPDTC